MMRLHKPVGNRICVTRCPIRFGDYKVAVLICIIHTIATWPPAYQTKRVNPAYRIGCVLIRVQATLQPDRVLADESPRAWVIVPMPAVDERGAADAVISFI